MEQTRPGYPLPRKSRLLAWGGGHLPAGRGPHLPAGRRSHLRPWRRPFSALASVACAWAALSFTVAPAPAGAFGVFSQVANPPVSVAAACAGPAVSARRCERASLAAIDDARASEGLEPMELPPGYQHLGVAEQLVVVTNLERTARDLPALDGPQAALDELASAGLSSGADPEGPPGTAWASNAAAGIDDALQADYEWMYDDGPGGTNVDCTSTSQSGCWEHRANILSPWPGAIGAAGEATAGQRLVLAEVMVARN